MPGVHKRATISDVARRAGLSIATVSYVLNGSRPVGAEARQQVLAAAKELGYRVNSAAQTLRRQSSKTIGLCTTAVSTVYLRELANALDEIAAENGYELIQVLTRQDPARELASVTSLLSRQVDGLVLLPSLQPQASLDAISRSGTPAVVVDRLCEDQRFNYVIVDNHAAMRNLADSLVADGHRRILLIAQNLDVVTTRHRLAGLEETARLSGGVLRYEAIQRGDDEERFAGRLASLLTQTDPATAVIAGNSSVALSTLKALKRIERPARVALATFDDPEWAEILSVPLTSVRVPIRQIASAVWSLLIRQIEGADRAPEIVQIGAELVKRI